MISPSTIKRLVHRISAAMPLLAGLNILSPACVQAQTYVSHPELTPYQLVAYNGTCVQAYYVHAHEAYNARLAPCNANENLQKFYLLQASKDADVIPQEVITDPVGYTTVRARIVMAPHFDDVTPEMGQYQQLAADHQGIRYVQFTRKLNQLYVGPDQILWEIVRDRDPAPELTVIATENTTFHVAGERTVYYGFPGRMTLRQVQGYGNVNGFPCTNQFFGQDPAVGMPKACYVPTPDRASHRFQVKFLSLASANGSDWEKCLSEDVQGPGTLETTNCFQPADHNDPAKARFTLRPTSYPK